MKEPLQVLAPDAWQPEFDFVVSPAAATAARPKNSVRMAGTEPKVLVECGIAGIMHQQDKNATLSRLRLKDPVQVVREPENEHDKNAMAVLARNGKACGYLPKELAGVLAGHLPADAILPAIVTELKCAPDGSRLRMGIAFTIPKHWMDGATGAPQSVRLAYDFEKAADHFHLLVTGSQTDIQRIKTVLTKEGMEPSRDGYAHKATSKGRKYEWYFRFEFPGNGRTTPEQMEALLTKLFNTVSDSTAEARILALEAEYRHVAEQVQATEQKLKDMEALATEVDDDYQQEKAKAGGLRTELERVEKELFHYRQAHAALASTTASAATKQDPAGGTLPERVKDAFVTVAEDLTPEQSLLVMQALFPERITILNSAFSSAQGAKTFKYRRAAFELLWLLADDYWTALSSGQADCDARKVFGASYAAAESATTESNTKAMRRRTFHFDGQNVEMPKHLKIGVKDSKAESLRVHFEWFANQKRIVVGHCGEHLPLK